MALSHYDREEETLIAYFKQMLSEEVEELEADAESQSETVSATAQPAPADEPSVAENQTAAAQQETAETPAAEPVQAAAEQTAQDTALSAEEAANQAMIAAQEAQSLEPAEAETAAAENAADGAEQEAAAADNYAEDYDRGDYESDEDYDQSYEHESYDYTPKLQPQEQEAPQNELPYASPSSLQSLLEKVPAPAVQTATAEAEPEVAVAVAEPEVETVTETVQETTAVQEDTHVVEAVKNEAPALPDGLQWENIETPNEFQALFFLARGVRFAVPLVDLGGIYECSNVTSLFGKPAWYKGISDVRGRKINVVDTLKWVKPDVKVDSEFKYIILLGDSLWSICCDELEGNRYLNKENVKWRQNAGNRPWLAGIVKKEMCALLHVNALVTMFGEGFDLKTLQE
ncbi:MAG: chemotaxis protein CheW [Succinivibrio sp.]|nr:chemotaxis protein CheW [Succinivibrio sp.]